MTSESTSRPPLPRPLRWVIGIGVLLFMLPFAYLGGVEPAVVLGLGALLVLGVLVLAFGMLREYFSRTRPKRAKARPQGGGTLFALAAALAGASAALGHAVERDTSFYQLDVQSTLVAAIEVHEGGISEASATVRAVYRAPEQRAPSVGEKLTLSLPPFQIDSGTFVRGVVVCFAQRTRRGWTVVTGPHMGTVRTPEQYAEDGLVDFLGLKVGDREIRAALSRHVELTPTHIDSLHGDLRELAAPYALAADGRRKITPLADQRMGVLEAWVASGNPLLTLSALIDAFELADEARPLDSLSPPRVLMPGVMERMEQLAIRALASDNWHLQSAALAVLERVGFGNCPVALVEALCKRKHGEHLAIVRCEAHRFLPRCKGASDTHLKLLVGALADPTMREGMNDWVADGIAEAARLGEPWEKKLLALVEPLATSEDWYDNESAVRAFHAIGSTASFTRLHALYADEPPGELRDLMQTRLLDWADASNTAIVDMLSARRKVGPYLTMPEQRAVEASVKAWTQLTESGAPSRVLAYHKSPVGRALAEFAANRSDALISNIYTGDDSVMDAHLVEIGDPQALQRLFSGAAIQDPQVSGLGEVMPHAMPHLIAALKRATPRHSARLPLREVVENAALALLSKLPRDATTVELTSVMVDFLMAYRRLPSDWDADLPREHPPLPDTDDPDLLAIATLVCGGDDSLTARARLVTIATTPGAHQAAAIGRCLTLKIAPDKEAAERLENQADFADPILLARLLHLANPIAAARKLKTAFEQLPFDALGNAAKDALADPESPLHVHTAAILIPRLIRTFERVVRRPSQAGDSEPEFPESDLTHGGHVRVASDYSLILNQLAGHDEGYCAAAAFDAESCAELGARWVRWLGANGANLAYDPARKCFRPKESRAGNEDQDGGSR